MVDGPTVPIRHPVFQAETLVAPGFFRLQVAERHYLVRLRPFAVFELDSGTADAITPDAVEALGAAGDWGLPPRSLIQALLIVTTDCTLACSYCYAYRGSYGMAHQTMTVSVARAAVDLVLRHASAALPSIAHPGVTYELGAVCFGGEPLLALDVVRAVDERLNQGCAQISHVLGVALRPLVTVNTNGVTITKAAWQFLEEARERLEVVVSYDGRLHDRERRTSAGRPTASVVLKNVLALKAAGIDVLVTSCILPEAVAEPEETLDALEPLFELGIPTNLSFIRGGLGAVRADARYPGLIQEAYEADLLTEFGRAVAARIAKGAPIFVRRWRQRVGDGGYKWRCAAGVHEFAVVPDGRVYPCHNFVSEGTEIGNILETNFQLNSSHSLLRQLASRTVDALPPCRGCVFQSTCLSSFDCPAHSLQDLGDLMAVDERFCGFARTVQAQLLRDLIGASEKASAETLATPK